MCDRYWIYRAPLWIVTLAAMFSVGCTSKEKPVIPGLQQPVEILRDRWGIAHIYARNEHDLFLAQGYNAARDRLFQLELWRRRATGTLAEIQGPRALPGDIGARLLRFRGDMGRELSHYHPRGAEIVGAFVEGINAYIDRTERGQLRLPIEFRSPGNQARQVDARDRGLAAQRAVSQRHPGGSVCPARPRPGSRPRPGHPQPAPRATRAQARRGDRPVPDLRRHHRGLHRLARRGPLPPGGRRARVPREGREPRPRAGEPGHHRDVPGRAVARYDLPRWRSRDGGKQ